MDKLTQQLVSCCSSIEYHDFPPEVVHRAKALLIDSLGCAIAAYSSEPAKIARAMAATVKQCDMPSTVIGSGHQSTLDLATFANGVMIRQLDFNDGYVSSIGGGHPSDNFAPVLSCAEAFHASGKELLTAAVLAYEVFCRLADTMEHNARGLDSCVPGVISSVLAASKLMRLSEIQISQALNLAIAANLALRQTRVGEVSMWKGCAMGNASRNAVFAAQLAKRGMTGPGPIFEGRYGLFRVTGPFQLDELANNVRPFRIMEVSIKRYPCVQLFQTAIDAALKLRSQIADVREIARVNVDTFRQAKDAGAGDPEKWRPSTRETADHSLPYVIAIALTYGSVGIGHFDSRYREDPGLLELMRRISVRESDDCNALFPLASVNRLELVTGSGRRFQETVRHHRGHYLNPLTDKEVEQKFDSLTRGLMAPAQAAGLLSLVWALEQVDDAAGKILQLTTLTAGSQA